MLLADTSAWVWSRRRGYPDVRARFDALLRAGEIAVCDVVKLELLYGIGSGAELDRRRADLDRLRGCPIGRAEWRRAIDVASALAHRAAGSHRDVPWPDLLVAAAAESAGLELLHYDRDYERVREVTGQPMRWLAEPGSLG